MLSRENFPNPQFRLWKHLSQHCKEKSALLPVLIVLGFLKISRADVIISFIAEPTNGKQIFGMSFKRLLIQLIDIYSAGNLLLPIVLHFSYITIVASTLSLILRIWHCLLKKN
jgi:hypothetical protein